MEEHLEIGERRMAAMHWMARDLVWPPMSLGERGGKTVSIRGDNGVNDGEDSILIKAVRARSDGAVLDRVN